MIAEPLKQLIEDVDALINDGAIPRREHESRLWEAAERFWERAFPAGISPEDRHSIWLGVASECDLEVRSNGRKILDVLEWPAKGDTPRWM